LQPDSLIPDPSNPQAWNRYSYVMNRPINFSDPTGHWVETALDIAFIAYDIYDISKNGLNWENGLSLTADVAGAVLPFVTGGGAIVRAAMHADDVVDTVKVADKVIDTTKAWDKLKDYANIAGDICSFSADTKVTTEDGEKSISAIEVGDYVLAWNEVDGTIGFYEVTDTFSHADEVLTELIIDGEWIETTPEHPFYTKEVGWLPADKLESGMHVRQADGDYELVWLKWNVHQIQEMYNLTVDEAHTYFVGEGQWLVHNSCDDWVKRFTEEVGRPPLKGHDLHHGYPRQFVEWFEAKGIDIHAPKNMFELPRDLHTRKPDGIHTGTFEESWNGRWKKFKDSFGNASRNAIIAQRDKLAREFGITRYLGGAKVR
jgi:hypothetical protein